eukprot:30612-Pelagococcus_subviridis.AAC.19
MNASLPYTEVCGPFALLVEHSRQDAIVTTFASSHDFPSPSERSRRSPSPSPSPPNASPPAARHARSIPPIECPTPASALDLYVSKSKSPNVGVCCFGAPVFASVHSFSFLHGRENPTPRHSTIQTSCPRWDRNRAGEKPGATSNVYAFDAHPGTITTGSGGGASSSVPARHSKSESSHAPSIADATDVVRSVPRRLDPSATDDGRGRYRDNATDHPLSGIGKKCISSAPSISVAFIALSTTTTSSGGGTAAAAAAAAALSRRSAMNAPTGPTTTPTPTAAAAPVFAIVSTTGVR